MEIPWDDGGGGKGAGAREELWLLSGRLLAHALCVPWPCRGVAGWLDWLADGQPIGRSVGSKEEEEEEEEGREHGGLCCLLLACLLAAAYCVFLRCPPAVSSNQLLDLMPMLSGKNGDRIETSRDDGSRVCDALRARTNGFIFFGWRDGWVDVMGGSVVGKKK
jgi:hypothetical protein